MVKGTEQSTETVSFFPNVHVGKNVVFHDWIVVGLPPKGAAPGELETVIEDGAVIRSNTIIYAGSRIGSGFQTGQRAVLGPGLEIGANCSVGNSSVLLGYARLGNGAKVHGHSTIGNFSILQEKSWVGPYCLLDGNAQSPPIIAAGAILGARVYVAAGVRVGERSLIAAGTILKQDVPPYRLVAGNPPRALRDIGRLTCPYELVDRPYEPDPLSVQEIVKARYALRPVEESPEDTWRHQIWNQLNEINSIGNR